MPPYGRPRVSPENQNSRGPSSGYVIVFFNKLGLQSSDEGRKVVQQTHLHVLLLQRKGGPMVPPPGASSDGNSVCGSLIMFAALEPEQADCPSLSVEFWYNPNCHMNYS